MPEPIWLAHGWRALEEHLVRRHGFERAAVEGTMDSEDLRRSHRSRHMENALFEDSMLDHYHPNLDPFDGDG